MPEQPLKKWDFNPRRFRYRIAALHGLGLVALAGACAAGFALGAITGLQALGIVPAALFAGKLSQYLAYRQKEDRRGFSFPPKNIHRTADALFEKAGLKFKPLTQLHTVYDPDKRLLENAYINLVPKGKTKDIFYIHIGETLLVRLNPEEITAILAHETAHAINKPPVASATAFLKNGLKYGISSTILLSNPFFIGTAAAALLVGRALRKLAPTEALSENFTRKGKIIGRAGIAGSIFFANPVLAVLAGAAALISRITHNAAERYDEDRADRNALYLYPHPTALRTALAKIEFPEAAPRDLLKLKANDNLLTSAWYITRADHTDFNQRMKLAIEFYREAEAFYRENGKNPAEIRAALSGMADSLSRYGSVKNAHNVSAPNYPPGLSL